MKRLLLLITLTSIFCGTNLKSQEIYNLTLEESIEIAKEKSLSMLKLQQDLKIAEHNLQSATRRLKTHIDLSLTTPQYTEAISYTTIDGVRNYYTEKSLGYSGGLSINQPLPTDGSIYFENNFSTNKNIKDDLRATQLGSRIGLEQPLDALYAYNNVKATLKRAELAYERSNKALKREELNLIYQVSREYYNLLSLQKSTEIAILDLDRQTEAFEISKNKFEAGLIREVDALQMEVDLAEAQNNYDIATVDQISARNSFKELLGINLNDSVNLNSALQYDIVIINSEKAVELALKNRLEIREQEIQIELQKLNIKQQKADGMIKGSISAHIGKSGINPQGRDADGNQLATIGFSESLRKSFDDIKDRPINYGVGFTIKVPILDWGENRAKVRATEARLKQITYEKQEIERSIETEVKNLVANTNSNLKRLQLLEKNVVVAEKSFEITRQRYSDGDIDSQTLALERDRLNKAYKTHLSAYINYQLSLADLMRKTFYDFKTQQGIE